MSSCQAGTVEKLWEKIDDMLVSESERLEIPLRGKRASSRFRFLIEDLAKRNREEIVSGGCGAAGVRTLPIGRGADGRGRTPGAPSLAAQALAQIKEKGYAEKYLRQGKKVSLVGAAFDAEMSNLSDRAIEVVPSF